MRRLFLVGRSTARPCQATGLSLGILLEIGSSFVVDRHQTEINISQRNYVNKIWRPLRICRLEFGFVIVGSISYSLTKLRLMLGNYYCWCNLKIYIVYNAVLLAD